MKKIKMRRLMSLLIALAMILGVVPAVISADSGISQTVIVSAENSPALKREAGVKEVKKIGITEYPVWVGGVQITDENKGDVLEDGTVSFAPDTSTLTLDGATIDAKPLYYTDEENAGIHSLIELNLELKGKNVINPIDAENFAYAINIFDNKTGQPYDITIFGDGELSVESGNANNNNSYIIYAENVTINSGKIAAKAGDAGRWSQGIYSNGGLVTINGGEVELKGGNGTAGSCGIRVNPFTDFADIKIKGGTVILSGETNALNQLPDLTEYSDPKVTVSVNADGSGAGDWDNTTALGGDESPYKYVSIEKGGAVPKYTVSLTDAGEGASGAGEYAQGEEVTIKAGTKAGYTFKKWEKVSGEVTFADEASATTTFTMPDEDVEVKAIWEKMSVSKYEVTLYNTGVGADGEGKYTEGEKVYIDAGTKTGYTFKKWIVESGDITLDYVTSRKTKFTMPAEDVDIRAMWEKKDTTGSSGHSFIESEPAGSTPKPSEKKTRYIELKITIGSNIMEKTADGIKSNIVMDTIPFIENSRTMLPIRYVAESLDMNVSWDAISRTATIYDETHYIVIPVDSPLMTINGKIYQSDVAPVIRDSRTYLSISNFAKALGMREGTDILWDAVKREALIRAQITK